MPRAPRRICSGCGEAVDGACARCSAKRTQTTNERRGTAASRGYGWEWSKPGGIRARILARDPICTICHDALSTVADHIIAKANGGTDEDSNLRGVCASCHAKSTDRGGWTVANSMRRA